MNVSDLAVDCSIIVFARNESDNLRKNLPKLLQQDILNLEVLVIDDDSSDKTMDVLDDLSSQFSALKVIHLASNAARGKKAHMRRIITMAEYPNILLTDADCAPQCPEWAGKMAACIEDTHQIVAGYSPVYATKGFLNSFIRYENLITAIQTIGLAGINLPYMAVGRNLAYDRNLHLEYDIYRAHAELKQGDDDLAIQDAIRYTSIQYCLEPATFVYTEGANNLESYINQKKRHLSTGRKYPFKILTILGAFNISWALLYLTIVLSIYTQNYFFAAAIYLIRLFGMFICFSYYQKKLQQQLSIFTLIITDLCYPFFILLTGVLSQLKPNIKWK